jgi:hypothetical protein
MSISRSSDFSLMLSQQQQQQQKNWPGRFNRPIFCQLWLRITFFLEPTRVESSRHVRFSLIESQRVFEAYLKAAFCVQTLGL